MILHVCHQTALRMLERYGVMPIFRMAFCANFFHSDNSTLSTEKLLVLNNDILLRQQYRVVLVLIVYTWFFGFTNFK